MPNTMRILNEKGDMKVIWNTENEDEVEGARKTFNEFKKKGYMAYSVKKDGSKGKIISEFDPEAEHLIMTPKLTGG